MFFSPGDGARLLLRDIGKESGWGKLEGRTEGPIRKDKKIGKRM